MFVSNCTVFVYVKSSLIPKDSNESHVIGVLKTEPQRVKYPTNVYWILMPE